ncbi:olfactory receptor 7G2-like [Ctenodactylus gundi]
MYTNRKIIRLFAGNPTHPEDTCGDSEEQEGEGRKAVLINRCPINLRGKWRAQVPHGTAGFINYTEAINQTTVSEFLLLGLTEDPDLQPLVFSLFLCMYLVTILGNLLTVLAVGSDPHLHTPMYFFLANLSFNDICLSSTVVPKMLVNIRAQDQSITYLGCLSQACFVSICTILENFLLAVMAYDRYVAICHPLRYTAIMSPCLCVLLVLLSVLISVADALAHTLMLLRLSFMDLGIPHFFCEVAAIIKLACSNTLIHDILIFTTAGVLAGVPLSGIIFSYIQIVSFIVRLPSLEGRHKAFSTCGSHLAIVSLFYGSGFGVYISSVVTDSPRKTAVASVMYSVMTQMLNPLIYTLRNKDTKNAFKKFLGRTALQLCFYRKSP